MPKKFIWEVKYGWRRCSGPPRSITCTRSLWWEGLESWKSHQIGIYAQKNYLWGQNISTELFRATQINNMYHFSVAWGAKKLKITPDWYLYPKNLFVSSNHVHGVVQGHPDLQHVPVLCGVKGYRVKNHTRLVFMPKKFTCEVKSGPWSCSWPPWSTTCTHSLWCEGLESWKSHQTGIFASVCLSCSGPPRSTTCTRSLWCEGHINVRSNHPQEIIDHVPRYG